MGSGRRPFFFESESNFYSYRTETFSLNVLNRSNLHSQLSQRWCWVLDLEYNHNFLKFPYLGNPESYQPNIRKTYQSNWFLAMTEICKIREWSYTHAGKTKPLSLELVVTCRGAEYQNGGMEWEVVHGNPRERKKWDYRVREGRRGRYRQWWCRKVIYSSWAKSCPLFLWIKFYWNTVMPNCLLTDCDCFGSTMAELNSCHRSHMAYKA